MRYCCANCLAVLQREPEFCPVCKMRFVPDDVLKIRPSEAEDQLLDDISRTHDKVLWVAVIGHTQCPQGCETDAAGGCEHGYLSLGMRANWTTWNN